MISGSVLIASTLAALALVVGRPIRFILIALVIWVFLPLWILP